MTYAEQLKSPKWQKKRLEILERDNYECRECKSKDRKLHVHHGYYDRDRLAWEYENKYLHTLCESCHKVHHEKLQMLMKLSGEMLPTTIDFIYGILYYLDQVATRGTDYDNGDLYCYADWIIENIREAKNIKIENEY
jgi:hypothetical protein